MTNSYQNLLVILDGELDTQFGLERALFLRHKLAANLTVMLIIDELCYQNQPLLSDEEALAMREMAIAERESFIQQQLRHYHALNYQVTVKVVFAEKPISAILQQVENYQHDLLLKTAKQPTLLDKVIFTPFDWQLLRKCPCPVWIVKDRDWREPQSALVAVNLGSDDPFHQTMNQQLIETSQELLPKFSLDYSMSLISACELMPATETLDCPDLTADLIDYPSKAPHYTKMMDLQRHYHLDPRHCLVESGAAAKVIPTIAAKLNVDIVIIGSRARQGISATFLGNTAELVIDSLHTDILVIPLIAN